MFARVTEEFAGRPDDQVMPRQIAVGEVITGELAEAAVRAGWAEAVPPNSKTETPEPAADGRPVPPNGRRKRKET